MTSPPDLKILISTLPDREAAGRIADQLVDERLAACVQILPGLLSVYRWEGAVQKTDESLLLVKTTRPADCQARLAELHPYAVPEILVLPVESALPAYLDWAAAACRDD